MIAASLAPPSAADAASGAFARVLARTWVPVLHALMVGFAFALFYYPVYGLAGLHRHHAYLQTGWRDLRAQVQAIEDEVLAKTGRRPAVVGLDKHNTADEMAYYDPRGDGARDTASRHLFYDEDALMYEFWFPPQAFDGRDLILVARSRGDLEDARVAGRATRLGPVRTLEPRKHGAPADATTRGSSTATARRSAPPRAQARPDEHRRRSARSTAMRASRSARSCRSSTGCSRAARPRRRRATS